MAAHTDEYLEYLKSPEWKAIRINLFKARGKQCNRCGSKKAIQVHHLTYKRLFNERMTDLEILCSPCHKREHGIKVKTAKRRNKKAKAVIVKTKKPNNPISKHGMQRLSNNALSKRGYSPSAIKEYQDWWKAKQNKAAPVVKAKSPKQQRARELHSQMDAELYRKLAYSG